MPTDAIDASPSDVSARLGDLGGCVSLDRVHSGPLVRVVHWQCLHDGPELRAERAHHDFVLTMPHHGASRLHVGGWSTVVDPTRAVLHGPGTAYRTTHPYGCGDRGCNVAIERRAMLEAVAEVDARQAAAWRRGAMPPVQLAVSPARGFVRQVLLARRARRRLPLEPLAVEEGTLALVAAVARQLCAAPAAKTAVRADTRRAHARTAEAARAMLDAQFTEPLTIAAVARAVGASPFHLCRVFRRGTGMPIHAYLTRLRLAAALDRVAEGEADLARLALDTGFASHSHLSTAFRRAFGLAPSDARRLVAAPDAAWHNRFPQAAPWCGDFHSRRPPASPTRPARR